ncbi:MAG: TraB/GumN family protein, partial [Bacteroidota bacterium]
SLLWEISGNGLKTSSYLYGTIHMIGSDDYFLTEKTKEAIETSKLLTLEINLEEMMDMANMFPLLMKSFMKNDTTLRDLLSDEDYKLVSDHFQKTGLPIMFVEKIKPMFLSALGGEDMMSMNQSGDVKSYELEFTDLAKNKNIPVAGLETAEYQMSMFDSIPYKVQAEMLVSSIKSPSEKSGDDQFNDLVKLYKNRDLYGLQQMLQSDESGINDYGDLLLNNRNRNWIPIMEDMMDGKQVFFAVGAGHLAGEEGVIALLRKEGYKVKAIMEKRKK